MDDRTRAVYETQARAWAEQRPPRLQREAATFTRRCLPGRPIVDLGCGPGTYAGHLGRPLVGLDYARPMLQLSRERHPDVAVVQGDLGDLPFAPRSLGGAWARASYLHLPATEIPLAWAQLHRALAFGAPVEMTLRAGTGDGTIPDDDFAGRFFSHWQPLDLASVVVGAGFDMHEDIAVTGKDGEWLTVRARSSPTLPDFVAPGMRVLVCGLNPSVVSADAGYNYSGATNRFWTAAVRSGLVDGARARRPVAVLRHDRVGLTDVVKRATPRASELTTSDYRAGLARVARLATWLRPGAVLFVGLAGWRAAADRGARAGVQPLVGSGPAAAFGDVPVYVMPSTSGLNAATPMVELVDHMRAALALGASC